MEIMRLRLALRKKKECLEPGTTQWMDLWKNRPELQSKMLEFKKTKSIYCVDADELLYNLDRCIECNERDCEL